MSRWDDLWGHSHLWPAQVEIAESRLFYNVFQTISTSHSCTSNPVSSCYAGSTSKTLSHTFEVPYTKDFSPFQIKICVAHIQFYQRVVSLNESLPISGKSFSWLTPNLLFPVTELFVHKILHALGPLPTCYLLSKFYLIFPTQFTHLLLFFEICPDFAFVNSYHYGPVIVA